MPKIHRLPPEVSSRIAAGEVIERPASVLKELLENSLDAGASKINIEAQGAGRKLLRVADDGEGMGPEDCKLAFDRHATSKIAALEDLESLSTFGFRGEALFSIAAVSKAALTSCARGSKKGWIVQAEGGKIKAEHEAPPVPGTTLEIRDLFYNTPARAKFLKSDPSEKSHLTHAVEEAALANPSVAFTYKSDNRTSLRLAACDGKDDRTKTESHRRRIAEVLGGEWGDGLLSASETRGDLKILAFLAPSDRLGATRSLQFFFVNRRPVAGRLLQQALYRAYEPFRSRDRHPVAVVFLDLPPDQFDVNVHPAKREVRFRRERELFEALTGIFSSTLLKSKGIPTIGSAFGARVKDLRPEGGAIRPSLPSTPAGFGNPPYDALGATGKDAPLARGLHPSDFVREESGRYPADEEAPRLDLASPTAATAVAARRGAHWPRWFTPPFRFLGQIERSYLVFDADGGLLVVDQHAAQERIFYERYLAELESGRVRSQSLLLPLPIELPASRIQQLLARGERLKRAGFEAEPFGKTTLHVTAAPALFHAAEDLKEMFHRLLDSLESEGAAVKDVRRHATATIACKAAVKAHDRLGDQEALRLLDELKDCKDGTACPHGRPSMISLTRDELARKFKRPGAPPRKSGSC